MKLRPLSLLLALALAAFLPRPVPAAAKVVQDAHCDATTGANDVLGSKAYAESFVAEHSGPAVSGFVETFNVHDVAATYEVDLWNADAEGFPTGTAPLASTTVVNPHAGFEFDFPTFATPANVVKGQNYAWVVTVPDAANNGVTIDQNNPCPGIFAISANGSIGGFQSDNQHRDMEFSVNIKIKRRHHKH